MTDFITVVYLFYTFVALYFLFLYILVYVPNRKFFYYFPITTKTPSLSIIIPCYNEEKSLTKTVECLLNSDYEGLKKIIIVDDCSKDNSYKVAKELEKKYSKVIAVQTPSNTGKASGSKNYGIKFADTELIGFTDADSYPQRDSIKKMIGFFEEKGVGGVTSTVLVENRKNFLERLQSVEYKIIAFTRKLLDFVDAIYVTPGPLGIYRRDALKKVNGFDENNMTEDIEITWNLVSKGYKIRMSSQSKVYTVAPDNVKAWFNQRVRWNVGGIQTILKYKKFFLREGMLGIFIIPFFIFSWFLGVTGLLILLYRGIQTLIMRYLSTSYSIQAQTAIITFKEIMIYPNVLLFFGITLLIMSILFTFFALSITKEKEFKKHSVIDVLVFMFAYLLAYPIILTVSAYKFLRGRFSW